MEVTISQFRKELFTLAEAALRGEAVTITYKGQKLRLKAEREGSIFDRVTPMKMTADPEPGDEDLSLTSARLLAEMEKEWEEDWKDIGKE
ncbi:MAG: hypothetical protein SGI92_08050 [Bryobacteraceae bacterium]|nr:hypothetical protein [Bryobacteraceae bacterium]